MIRVWIVFIFFYLLLSIKILHEVIGQHFVEKFTCYKVKMDEDGTRSPRCPVIFKLIKLHCRINAERGKDIDAQKKIFIPYCFLVALMFSTMLIMFRFLQVVVIKWNDLFASNTLLLTVKILKFSFKRVGTLTCKILQFMRFGNTQYIYCIYMVHAVLNWNNITYIWALCKG